MSMTDRWRSRSSPLNAETTADTADADVDKGDGLMAPAGSTKRSGKGKLDDEADGGGGDAIAVRASIIRENDADVDAAAVVDEDADWSDLTRPITTRPTGSVCDDADSDDVTLSGMDCGRAA